MEKTKTTAKEAVVGTTTVEPVATTVTPVAATPVTQVVTVETKKGGGAGKCILIGCGLLLLCCCITIVLIVVASQMVISSGKGKDASLTRLATAAEVTQLVSDVDKQEGTVGVDGSVTLSLSEKELLAIIVSSLKFEQTPDKVGLKITPGDLKLDVELGALINSFNTSNNRVANSWSSGSSLENV